jgi:murein DD-endopeptidase MepM/ murein hydrolase activator NlpD
MTCSVAILGPARADDAPLAAAAGTVGTGDAGRVALPDAATAIVDPDPIERQRWFQRVAPLAEMQALVVQPLLGGVLTSEFGMRRHPLLGTWEGHEGVDYSAPRGTFVFAAADGTVSFAGWDSGYGNTVRITHSDGVETVYAHLGRIEAGVEPGAIVVQGYVFTSKSMSTAPPSTLSALARRSRSRRWTGRCWPASGLPDAGDERWLKAAFTAASAPPA